MGGVIRFPTERRLEERAGGRAGISPSGQTAPAAEPAADGQPFALLSAEVRRMPRSESRIEGDVAGRILSRCVLAALEVVSKERVPVDLAGTVVRPVIEATFTGADGTTRAARAATAIRQAVTKVQREVELEFHVFGAIAAGTVSRSEDGVTLTAGAPDLVAARLREHAAAGEFLVTEEVLQGCEGEVGQSIEVILPGAGPIVAYPLSEAP